MVICPRTIGLIKSPQERLQSNLIVQKTVAYVGLTLYKATRSISTPRLPCHANDCCYSQLHPELPPASPINMNMLGKGRHCKKKVSRLKTLNFPPIKWQDHVQLTFSLTFTPDHKTKANFTVSPMHQYDILTVNIMLSLLESGDLTS